MHRAIPRTAVGFTGHIGSGDVRGPGGALLLCVANTPIPCKLEFKGEQRAIQFTVINVRERGWIKAPWKKPTGKNAKPARDDTAKDLFEMGEWARDDVTMDRVGKSLAMYSFVKDGLSRGERADDRVSCVSSGQTFKVILNDFMFEDKKTSASAGGVGSRNVFPMGVDVIPAFSVVEIAVNPANTGGFDEGWGLNVARVRQCPFTLYSMMTPLGLELLPVTHAASMTLAESSVGVSPGLLKVVETRNTGFYGRVVQGSYLVKYGEDLFRLVGPKVNSQDPLSRHADVMEGGVFAIDMNKADLIRFTNATEEEDEDSLVYAQCLVDLAASAGALACYVVHNEYLLHNDPSRSPYRGVPLVITGKLLECVSSSLGVPDAATGEVVTRFPFPFSAQSMDAPFLSVNLACVDNNSAGEQTFDLPCTDLVLASENARVRCAYPLSLGDAEEEDIMRLLFIPKGSAPSTAGVPGVGSGRGLLERTDYRLLKRQRCAAK